MLSTARTHPALQPLLALELAGPGRGGRRVGLDLSMSGSALRFQYHFGDGVGAPPWLATRTKAPSCSTRMSGTLRRAPVLALRMVTQDDRLSQPLDDVAVPAGLLDLGHVVADPVLGGPGMLPLPRSSAIHSPRPVVALWTTGRGCVGAHGRWSA